jgi:hypothetical protein
VAIELLQMLRKLTERLPRKQIRCQCGAIYSAIYAPSGSRQREDARCQCCRTVLGDWSTHTFEMFRWRPTKPKKPTSKTKSGKKLGVSAKLNLVPTAYRKARAAPRSVPALEESVPTGARPAILKCRPTRSFVAGLSRGMPGNEECDP